MLSTDQIGADSHIRLEVATLTGSGAFEVIEFHLVAKIILVGVSKSSLTPATFVSSLGNNPDNPQDFGPQVDRRGNNTIGDPFNADTGLDQTITGWEGDDVINGRNGNDWLQGNTGNDHVFGDGGNDIVRGGKGSDFLHGGTGNDTLVGGNDNDFLWGDDGNDELYGDRTVEDPGDPRVDRGDTLRGGRGSNSLTGHGGDDIFVIEPDAGTTDTIFDFSQITGPIETTNNDRIDLSSFTTIQSFSQFLAMATQSGQDLVLSLPQKTVVVKNFYSSGSNNVLTPSTVTLPPPQNLPPSVGDQSFSLPENSANGATVGHVTGTDPDNGQSLNWTITSGNGSGAFSIDASTGIISVANASLFDFETTPTFQLVVQVTDNGSPSLSDSAVVTIALTDAWEVVSTVQVADSSLILGETTSVTFAFSEAVLDFTNADLLIDHGSLSPVTTLDGGVTWTATFTPDSGLEVPLNAITLLNAGLFDLSGNSGVGTAVSNTYAIDTVRPTVSIDVADTSLALGETSSVTFTFSEPVVGFSITDVTVENGTLSLLASVDGGVTWTATLTPDSDVSDATNLIALDGTNVTDIAGNAGLGITESNNYAIDNVRPTASIVLSDTSLVYGETSLVTITFSEIVTGFTNADLTVPNGTLSTVFSGDGGTTWTAIFTPNVNVSDATNVILLSATGVSDLFGNAGTGTTESANFSIDTTGIDFGDLPDSFGTLLASNGARHELSSLFLGAGVSPDPNGQPSSGANLDTDDGVVLPGSLVPGMGAVAVVTASQAGKLDAFIDFNGNGSFDADERITPTGGLALSAGLNSVSFVVPVNAAGGVQGARFRVSTAGGLAAVGATSDGEVEDYLTNVVNLTNSGIQQVADPEAAGQTMVIVTGTSGNDLIYVYPINGGFRAAVNGTLTDTLTASSRVVTFGMAGNDSIQYLSVNQSAWIDGGDGNDTLVGSNGDDVIYGRAGDDAIAGKKGVDAMFGNAGADTITGTGILVGGTEIDTLNAIGPRNLLIGGQGSDTLNAATGTTATGDLMIGSWTDWDDNLAALRSLRAEWASPQSTNTRISHLTGVTPGGLNGQYLLTSDLVSPGSTVHNDNIADINRNSNAEDWLFIFAGDQRINLIGHVNY